jgi:hypothetical protein
MYGGSENLRKNKRDSKDMGISRGSEICVCGGQGPKSRGLKQRARMRVHGVGSGAHLLDGRDATLGEEDEAFHSLLAAQAVDGRTAFGSEREKERQKGKHRREGEEGEEGEGVAGMRGGKIAARDKMSKDSFRALVTQSSIRTPSLDASLLSRPPSSSSCKCPRMQQQLSSFPPPPPSLRSSTLCHPSQRRPVSSVFHSDREADTTHALMHTLLSLPPRLSSSHVQVHIQGIHLPVSPDVAPTTVMRLPLRLRKYSNRLPSAWHARTHVRTHIQ